jgi:hypothetical protein
VLSLLLLLLLLLLSLQEGTIQLVDVGACTVIHSERAHSGAVWLCQCRSRVSCVESAAAAAAAAAAVTAGGQHSAG